MKHSKRDSEGVMMVNHKDSPGLTPEFLAEVAKAFPGEDTLPPGAGTGMFEAPIVTCVHCQQMVIINPLRNRQRGWCGKCAHYLCDKCSLNQKLGVPCRPYTQVIEDVINQNSNLKA
jgi:hypothetical protein